MRLLLTYLILPAAFYSALAVWLLWPLPMRAASAVVDAYELEPFGGVQVHADILLVNWILAWDYHALGSAPLGLFEANAFHPERRPLAFSEHLLGNLPIFAPLYAVTGNSILAVNGTMLASYVLSGMAMHGLIRVWTGSTPAALFAGILFAFNPWRLHGVAHYHLLNFQYLPLVLLAFDRLARSQTAPLVVAAAGILALQTLCSYYLGYIAFAAAAAFTALRGVLVERTVRYMIAALVALGIAASLVAAFTVPYILGRAGGELAFEQVTGWRLYVAAMGSPLAVTRRFVPPIVGVLTFVALLWTFRTRDREYRGRVLGLLAVVLTGYALSSGPGPEGQLLPSPYAMAERIIPGLSSVRDPTRFGLLVLLGFSALSGLGTASILGRFRTRALACACLLALALAPVWLTRSGKPYPVREIETGSAVPPVYRWLAQHADGGALLELPSRERKGFDFRGMADDARAMYFSTYHWLPLLNGYSGFEPRSHQQRMEVARRLPDRQSLVALVQGAELRWIILHDVHQHAELADGLRRLAEAHLIGVFGDDALYEVGR